MSLRRRCGAKPADEQAERESKISSGGFVILSGHPKKRIHYRQVNLQVYLAKFDG